MKIMQEEVQPAGERHKPLQEARERGRRRTLTPDDRTGLDANWCSVCALVRTEPSSLGR